MLRKCLSWIVIVSFFLTSLSPYSKARAQSDLGLPAPGTMINLSPAYNPVIIQGLTVHKDNPFLFDFLVDVGQDKLSGEALKQEGVKLIKYFLASLAIPEKDQWVNLSPYEQNKMTSDALGQTEMGRDLLEQDYILKQMTASLIYPEKQLGKTFWDRVYAKAQEMFGTTQVPVDTFNKVWIMADQAEVFEHNQTAFVTKQHLKVMLEEDYLSLQKHLPGNETSPSSGPTPNDQISNKSHTIASQIVRSIVLPELEKEVNTGRNFANLRQIFNSVILASWYKIRLKNAVLNQVYADKSKTNGINMDDPKVKEQIFQQYLQAYKKGVFNYIKEDMNAANGQRIPHKYFSGGTEVGVAGQPGINFNVLTGTAAVESLPMINNGTVDFATLAAPEKINQADAAMNGDTATLERPQTAVRSASDLSKPVQGDRNEVRIEHPIFKTGGYSATIEVDMGRYSRVDGTGIINHRSMQMIADLMERYYDTYIRLMQQRKIRLARIERGEIVPGGKGDGMGMDDLIRDIDGNIRTVRQITSDGRLDENDFKKLTGVDYDDVKAIFEHDGIIVNGVINIAFNAFSNEVKKSFEAIVFPGGKNRQERTVSIPADNIAKMQEYLFKNKPWRGDEPPENLKQSGAILTGPWTEKMAMSALSGRVITPQDRELYNHVLTAMQNELPPALMGALANIELKDAEGHLLTMDEKVAYVKAKIKTVQDIIANTEKVVPVRVFNDSQDARVVHGDGDFMMFQVFSDILNGRLTSFKDEAKGKTYTVPPKGEWPTVTMRVDDFDSNNRHITYKGIPVPAIFTSLVFAIESTPNHEPNLVFPKLESPEESVFAATVAQDARALAEEEWAKDRIAFTRFAVQGIFMNETNESALKLEVMLWAARHFWKITNVGRWDKGAADERAFWFLNKSVYGDLGKVTMYQPNMNNYVVDNMSIALKRNFLPEGGMVTQMPSEGYSDPEADRLAITTIVVDKIYEWLLGYNYAWVASPSYLPLVQTIFQLPREVELVLPSHTADVRREKLMEFPQVERTKEGLYLTAYELVTYFFGYRNTGAAIAIDNLNNGGRAMFDGATLLKDMYNYWMLAHSQETITATGEVITMQMLEDTIDQVILDKSNRFGDFVPPSELEIARMQIKKLLRNKHMYLYVKSFLNAAVDERDVYKAEAIANKVLTDYNDEMDGIFGATPNMYKLLQMLNGGSDLTKFVPELNDALRGVTQADQQKDQELVSALSELVYFLTEFRGNHINDISQLRFMLSQRLQSRHAVMDQTKTALLQLLNSDAEKGFDQTLQNIRNAVAMTQEIHLRAMKEGFIGDNENRMAYSDDENAQKAPGDLFVFDIVDLARKAAEKNSLQITIHKQGSPKAGTSFIMVDFDRAMWAEKEKIVYLGSEDNPKGFLFYQVINALNTLHRRLFSVNSLSLVSWNELDSDFVNAFTDTDTGEPTSQESAYYHELLRSILTAVAAEFPGTIETTEEEVKLLKSADEVKDWVDAKVNDIRDLVQLAAAHDAAMRVTNEKTVNFDIDGKSFLAYDVIVTMMALNNNPMSQNSWPGLVDAYGVIAKKSFQIFERAEVAVLMRNILTALSHEYPGYIDVDERSVRLIKPTNEVKDWLDQTIQEIRDKAQLAAAHDAAMRVTNEKTVNFDKDQKSFLALDVIVTMKALNTHLMSINKWSDLVDTYEANTKRRLDVLERIRVAVRIRDILTALSHEYPGYIDVYETDVRIIKRAAEVKAWLEKTIQEIKDKAMRVMRDPVVQFEMGGHEQRFLAYNTTVSLRTLRDHLFSFVSWDGIAGEYTKVFIDTREPNAQESAQYREEFRGILTAIATEFPGNIEITDEGVKLLKPVSEVETWINATIKTIQAHARGQGDDAMTISDKFSAANLALNFDSVNGQDKISAAVAMSFSLGKTLWRNDPNEPGFLIQIRDVSSARAALLQFPDAVLYVPKPEYGGGLYLKVDQAALAGKPRDLGGIDLNTSIGTKWKITDNGHGVEVNVDSAMVQEVRAKGVNYLTPVILRMTPVRNVWTLAGLTPPAHHQSAVV